MIRASQRHVGFLAAMVHRLSGLALILFLPAHFLVLGLALDDVAALDRFLDWTSAPSVKIAETLLVIAFTLHFSLGLRLLALEMLPWSGERKTAAGIGIGLSLLAGLLFLLNPN